MNATLTLDDDVAMLLERALRKHGGSLKKLGNELLRRTLEHEREISSVPSTGFTTVSTGEPAPAAPRAIPPPDAVSLETQIDQTYDEIRNLIALAAENPDLRPEVERKRERLHALQAEEATAWRQRAKARRHLKPGEGYRLLERAANLLDS